MCSNISITEILGINDRDLEILGNIKKWIKGIEYTVLNGRLTYTPDYCPKCGCINEKYDIVKNDSHANVNRKTVHLNINNSNIINSFFLPLGGEKFLSIFF
ncbi:transposase [Peptostreptococcus canis]|uniref:transposase n=1 Tax=Peptostreptococcus canis TaxID=1159213 RepID=UPI0016293838|nr:transposase [Peptostreptococcus canis]MBP1997574.1 hypothetical protein [Peptostreptococcus canis]